MEQKNVRYLAQGAMIAALYVAATYFSRLLGIADGAVQFRLSEALTVLPAFTPAAVPGLAIGCFIANIGSPYGIVDILSGTLATLLAALATRGLRGVRVRGIPVLAPVPPVLSNGLIVGLFVTMMNEAGKLIPQQFTFAVFGSVAASVALGELAVCVGLGLPLMIAVKKAGVQKIFPQEESTASHRQSEEK